MRRCRHCKARVESDEDICPTCGRIVDYGTAVRESGPLIALVAVAAALTMLMFILFLVP